MLAVCTPESGSVRLGLQLIKDVGAESANLVVEERERHGPYVTAGDLVRRTGLKPQAVLSLALAGAFDGIVHNRRESLWEAGLHTRPSRNGQAAAVIDWRFSTQDARTKLQHTYPSYSD